MLMKKLKQLSMTKIVFLVMVLIWTAFLPGSLSSAYAAAAVSSETLAAGQTLSGPGFFSGNSVEINGTVDGTAFAVGQEVHVNGTINGDLFAAAQVIYINGKINGNIYAAGQDLRVGTQSTGDVFMAGQRIEILPESAMGRDLFAAGNRVVQAGSVQRHIFAAAADILLGGTIGQNANLTGENIQLLDGMLIKGNLNYTSSNMANIASGAKINGQTDWEKTKPADQSAAQPQKQTAAGSIWGIFLSIASALLIWFLMRIWRPDFWTKHSQFIAEQPLKTIGTGAVAFLLTPLLIILLMITVVGIPLGIILGLTYGVAIYLCKIFVAVFFGAWLTKRFSWPERHLGVWPVLLALIIFTAIVKVPVIGFLVTLLVIFSGLGALVLAHYKAAPKSEPQKNQPINTEPANIQPSNNESSNNESSNNENEPANNQSDQS